MPSTKTKISILALTAATISAVTVGATAASAAPPAAPAGEPKTASVTGSAEFRLTFAPDHDVRSFTFDAHAAPYSRPLPELNVPHGLPTDARGTVKISHYVVALKQILRAEAEVDCLSTSPGNAAFTAKVTRADGPLADWVGKRLGFSVQDGGRHHDRVGLSWVVGNITENAQGKPVESTVGSCMAPAAFAPVTKGGYTVRHADLLPQPKR
ncbi:hypothetical protein [Actinomadura xylanilytica]|uniref:hypothetical protein n=1 Tax=Actinomadura xylanilytica TaxID=887459 RepID=UPI00255AA0D6|nr:hypothetical protein [Actinomadura xylanilytica]MDL4772782.1 hypothetical protein [Actinomadura xylanilytica]